MKLISVFVKPSPNGQQISREKNPGTGCQTYHGGVHRLLRQLLSLDVLWGVPRPTPANSHSGSGHWGFRPRVRSWRLRQLSYPGHWGSFLRPPGWCFPLRPPRPAQSPRPVSSVQTRGWSWSPRTHGGTWSGERRPRQKSAGRSSRHASKCPPTGFCWPGSKQVKPPWKKSVLRKYSENTLTFFLLMMKADLRTSYMTEWAVTWEESSSCSSAWLRSRAMEAIRL